MSIRIMSAIWTDAPYGGTTLLTLLALADWANDDGYCWPGIEAIAKKVRLGTRQVQNIMSQLMRDGAIGVLENGGGRGLRNTYRVNHAAESRQSVSVNSNSLNSDSTKSAAEITKPVSRNHAIQRGAIRKNRHKPLGEPSVMPRPALDDIAAYCRERANRVDPQQFLDYYISNGWRVGRVPMKDWRAAVRTWERNGENYKHGKTKPNLIEVIEREQSLVRA